MPWTLSVAKAKWPPSDPNGIKARNAFPDPVLTQDHWGPPGQEVSRTLRKVCPWCEDSFYTWQVYDQEKPPGKVDPEPDILPDGSIEGLRSTCGSPDCYQFELDHQTRRSPKFQADMDAINLVSRTVEDAKVENPGSKRSGGLQTMSLPFNKG